MSEAEPTAAATAAQAPAEPAAEAAVAVNDGASTAAAAEAPTATAAAAVEVDVADEIVSPPTTPRANVPADHAADAPLTTTEETKEEQEQKKQEAAAAPEKDAADSHQAAAAAPTEQTAAATTTEKKDEEIQEGYSSILATEGEEGVEEEEEKPKLAGSSAAASKKPLTPEQLEAEAAYARYLAEAQKQDYSDLERLQFLYVGGMDDEGRSVVVLIGSNLPAKACDMDRVFLYALKTLDPVVERDYVLVYIAANQSSANRPSFKWLRKAYSVFNRKYKKNLKKLYVVEASAWLRLVFNLFMGVVSRKFWAKVTFVKPLAELFQYLRPAQVRIPGRVLAALCHSQPLFGSSLQAVAHNNAQLREGLPVVVSQCLHFIYDAGLETEGILRVPGDRTLANQLRMQYDAGLPVRLDVAREPYTVTSLLKTYLRELPEPLMTAELHPRLVALHSDTTKSAAELLRGTAELLDTLPDINKAVLWNVVAFARAVAERSDENKMTCENIALCLGPTLTWSNEAKDPAAMMREMGPVNMLLISMINHPEIVPDTKYKIEPPKRRVKPASPPPLPPPLPPKPKADEHEVPPPPVEAPPPAAEEKPAEKPAAEAPAAEAAAKPAEEAKPADEAKPAAEAEAGKAAEEAKPAEEAEAGKVEEQEKEEKETTSKEEASEAQKP